MQVRFTQRWFLIALIAAAQLTCLLIGQTWFVGRLEQQLQTERQRAALDRTADLASGIAA